MNHSSANVTLPTTDMQARDQRVLYVRLPCNPIFPIGVVYLADHVHKLFPDVAQQIFDMGTVPPLDFTAALDEHIDSLISTW